MVSSLVVMKVLKRWIEIAGGRIVAPLAAIIILQRTNAERI
jgi:hypothetical protein